MNTWGTMQINYDEMLTAYNKNMETNLRGFAGGPPPFENWVPYEGDHVKSIQELIDIAIESGQEVITVESAHGRRVIHTERAKKAKDNIDEILREKGLPNTVTIISLKKNVLTIDYEEIKDTQPFHERLIWLEGELNDIQGEKFNIETINLEDKNKRHCAKN